MATAELQPKNALANPHVLVRTRDVRVVSPKRARRATVAAIVARAECLSRRELNATIEGLIAFADVLDGDCDLEEETDHCQAGDDQVVAGSIMSRPYWMPSAIGSDDDAEYDMRSLPCVDDGCGELPQPIRH